MTDFFFVTGTDSGVGKTFCTVALAWALMQTGRRVAVMKPVAAGAERTPEGLRNDDAQALIAASNVSAPYEIVNPYCLPLAASPHIAAAEAGVTIDVARLARCATRLGAGADVLLIEGAGGWLAPISERETMADVARALGAPILLVVGLRLGCLNHALLTRAAIRATGLGLAGWIANHLDPEMIRVEANIATLESRLDAPLLARIPHGTSAQAAVAALADAVQRPPFR
jgi:dethiobiotin synthetase